VRLKFFICLISGGLTALAFYPSSLGPLSFVSLVPFFVIVLGLKPSERFERFALGYMWGIGFFIVLLYWVVFLKSRQLDNPYVMSGLMVLMVGYLSIFPGLFSLLATALPRSWRLVSIPLVWSGTEVMRSLFVLGFPWGTLGYSLARYPSGIQMAAVTGVVGLSIWIAAVNTCFANAYLRKRVICIPLGLAIAVTPFVIGQSIMEEEITGDFRVALIQGNIEADLVWDESFRAYAFSVQGSISRQAARDDPDLIIWAETTATCYLRENPGWLQFMKDLAKELGIPILVGHLGIAQDENEEYEWYNAASIVYPDGSLSSEYHKIHLVPFGEVLPFETAIPWLRNVDLGEADFTPGREYVLLEVDQARFSSLVCFEAIFPRLVRKFADDGANFLVNITNDAWYMKTSMPHQHANMTILRAVENRRWLARCANSGVTMVIDKYGRVLHETELFRRTYVIEDVELNYEKTFFTRFGDIFGWLSLLAAIILPALGTRARN
jgi:apolipoprotein N-acyltransferase